jgi:hypothetical protein
MGQNHAATSRNKTQRSGASGEHISQQHVLQKLLLTAVKMEKLTLLVPNPSNLKRIGAACFVLHTLTLGPARTSDPSIPRLPWLPLQQLGEHLLRAALEKTYGMMIPDVGTIRR